MWTTLGIILLCLPLVLVLAFIGYVYVVIKLKYCWQVERIFVEKPLFIIPRGEADPAVELVRFPTADGMTLQGVYFKTPVAMRKGVIVFGIEYGSDCWSCRSYCDPLLAAGYDIFAYEPRSQGKSDVIAGYEPLQWNTRYEISDARAALVYLKARPDADPKGIGWFGVSKGANAGLAVASKDPAVRCVVTDGAFGVLSVIVPYMRHWSSIYNQNHLVQGLMPAWFYAHIALIGIRRVEKSRKVRFFHLERRVRRIRQPLLMIHGEADSYIKVVMARALFDAARGPKEFWAVPRARHNQSIAMAGEEYSRRVVAFFDQHLR
jgi:dipeptidyl aminopeptidase/acylaminoacyl peptidase